MTSVQFLAVLGAVVALALALLVASVLLSYQRIGRELEAVHTLARDLATAPKGA